VTTTLTLLAVGFFLGMRHATDADHVIAISTIVSRQRSMRGAVLIGGLWGIGHSITVAIVGGAIILFSVAISPRTGLAMEFAVGVMLAVLGIFNLAGFRLWIKDNIVPGKHRYHAHTHAHGDYAHCHVHGHGKTDHGHRDDQTPQARLDRIFGGIGLYQMLRPLVVGVVHGLAGSAAVALLVLAAIEDPFWGVVYIVVFGVGTIAGMMLITLAIAAPFAYTANRFPRFNTWLRVASGGLSLGLGLALMYHVGFVGGLFLPDPRG
jgi:high-affinity nickel permease